MSRKTILDNLWFLMAFLLIFYIVWVVLIVEMVQHSGEPEAKDIHVIGKQNDAPKEPQL